MMPSVLRFLAMVRLPTLADLRTTAADASLLLLVGGLAMLCLIMALVGVQNLVPQAAAGRGGVTARGHADTWPRLWPRPPRKVASGLPLDRAMARVVHLNLGEPRILQARTHTTRVRLFGCRGCTPRSGETASPQAGCARERAGVEQAFREIYGGGIAAWEIVCRRRGGESCDFEVKH